MSFTFRLPCLKYLLESIGYNELQFHLMSLGEKIEIKIRIKENWLRLKLWLNFGTHLLASLEFLLLRASQGNSAVGYFSVILVYLTYSLGSSYKYKVLGGKSLIRTCNRPFQLCLEPPLTYYKD